MKSLLTTTVIGALIGLILASVLFLLGFLEPIPTIGAFTGGLAFGIYRVVSR